MNRNGRLFRRRDVFRAVVGPEQLPDGGVVGFGGGGGNNAAAGVQIGVGANRAVGVDDGGGAVVGAAHMILVHTDGVTDVAVVGAAVGVGPAHVGPAAAVGVGGGPA